MKPIPFDSLVLAAVVAELQPWVGGKVQRAVEPDEHSLLLELYGGPGATQLMLSWHPQFARAHGGAARRKGISPPPGMSTAFRARVVDGRITAIRQIGFDRILEIDIDHFEGKHRIVAELMGKHANVVLVGPDGRIVAAAKHVPPSKSTRPVTVNRPYERPPFPPRPPIWKAKEGESLKEFDGASPFLVKLLAARGEQASVVAEWLSPKGAPRLQPGEAPGEDLGDLPGDLPRLKPGSTSSPDSPWDSPRLKAGATGVVSPGHGAYPVSVAALGYEESVLPEPCEAEPAPFGAALAAHFGHEAAGHETEQRRSSLQARLERVRLAREVALSDLAQALDAAAKAGRLQQNAELILAYGSSLLEGAQTLEAVDYDGEPITLKLDPEKTYLENAEAMFARAKKSKAAKDNVADQRRRLQEDLQELIAFVSHLEAAQGPTELARLEAEATKRRWLHVQRTPTTEKSDRPFEGHRVRELLGPNGYRVLYGENATSNDFLTNRVARPSDIWLHIRGSVSAHVVIVAGGKPERVGPEVIRFAAEIAVKNSPSKHSKYVPVDWTLKKYVRKPRSAPAGTVVYTHEKTVHVG